MNPDDVGLSRINQANSVDTHRLTWLNSFRRSTSLQILAVCGLCPDGLAVDLE